MEYGPSYLNKQTDSCKSTQDRRGVYDNKNVVYASTSAKEPGSARRRQANCEKENSHARLLVHARAEIGEGDAGPHRIGQIGRVLDFPCPMRLLRRDAFGAAVVEDGVVEGAGLHRGVELGDRLLQRRRIEFELAGQLGYGGARDRRKQRRHDVALSICAGDIAGPDGQKLAARHI